VTEVWQGASGTNYKNIKASSWDESTWTHVVATVSGTTMKLYKNGALVGTNANGHEPLVSTRTQHWLGRSNWGERYEVRQSNPHSSRATNLTSFARSRAG
jgi:hypothetical protein